MSIKNVKFKFTLAQALRLCTGRTAHRGSRGIALHFHDHGTRKGVKDLRHAPAALYTQERPGIHCTGGCVGPKADMDRCRKFRLHRDSIPGRSRPQPVAIPTTLTGPLKIKRTAFTQRSGELHRPS